MKVEAVELFQVQLPLVHPFRSARTTSTHKHAIIVRVRTASGDGWGECAADVVPSYTSEYLASAWITLRDHLVPAIVRTPIDLDTGDLTAPLAFVRGHPMAKAALEMALLDAVLTQRGIPLAVYLGASRTRVAVGVVVDLHERTGDALDRAARHLDQGYRRIKFKVEPGRDREILAGARDRFGFDLDLWIDANGSYELDDPLWSEIDSFALGLIEQPLAPRDLPGHAALARRLATPLCVDESVSEPGDIALIAQLKAAALVNLKPARVGGLLPALHIARQCQSQGLRVWIGGMLDTGVARAANLALAAAVGSLPGDISATDRYFERDLTPAFVLDAHGQLAVPDRPGLGVEIDRDYLRAVTLAQVTIR